MFQRAGIFEQNERGPQVGTKPEHAEQAAVPNGGWWEYVGRWRPAMNRLVGWSAQLARRWQPETCLRSGVRSAQSDYREDNQDAFYSDAERGVFVVADGVGGNSGGKIASQFVIDAFAQEFHETLSHGNLGPLDLERGMERALRGAQRRMAEYAVHYPDYGKMASTMAAAVVCGGTLFVGHVGDSRVYLSRRRNLVCVTRDDTYANALVSAGVISADEAQNHPLRHVLVSTVNAIRQVKHIPITVRYLAPGERVLLATDGLTGVVGDDEIWNTLRSAPTAQEAADALVDRAIRRDTHDNTTCVVVERLAVRDIPDCDKARRATSVVGLDAA